MRNVFELQCLSQGITRADKPVMALGLTTSSREHLRFRQQQPCRSDSFDGITIHVGQSAGRFARTLGEARWIGQLGEARVGVGGNVGVAIVALQFRI